MFNEEEQARLEQYSMFYHDGDNYIVTDAPAEVVKEVMSMTYDDSNDLGSYFYIVEFNKRGYVASWMGAIQYD